MKYALPLILLAGPAMAHPGPLHSHASVTDWLALAGIAAALAVPGLINSTVKQSEKRRRRNRK